MRCVHEASLHNANSFVTLTYNDDHLPEDRSLHYVHYQLFMKRLRKKFGPNVRFYMCGEYGETYGRPHYHAIFFNIDFEDRRPFKTVGGSTLYTSESLSRAWGHGYATIGSVTFESSAYVSRYIMKKVTGEQAAGHYEYINPETGEITQRKPEFTNMSRRPGIAAQWFEKFKTEVYPDDFVVMNGKPVKPPRYYDALYEAEFPSDFRQISLKRIKRGRSRKSDNTPARLAVREKVAEARLQQRKRTIE